MIETIIETDPGLPGASRTIATMRDDGGVVLTREVWALERWVPSEVWMLTSIAVDNLTEALIDHQCRMRQVRRESEEASSDHATCRNLLANELTKLDGAAPVALVDCATRAAEILADVARGRVKATITPGIWDLQMKDGATVRAMVYVIEGKPPRWTPDTVVRKGLTTDDWSSVVGATHVGPPGTVPPGSTSGSRDSFELSSVPTGSLRDLRSAILQVLDDAGDGDLATLRSAALRVVGWTMEDVYAVWKAEGEAEEKFFRQRTGHNPETMKFEVTGPPLSKITPGIYDLTMRDGREIRAEVGVMPGVGPWWVPHGRPNFGAVDDWSDVVGAIKLDHAEVMKTLGGDDAEPLREYHPRLVSSSRSDGALKDDDLEMVAAIRARTGATSMEDCVLIIGRKLRRWRTAVDGLGSVGPGIAGRAEENRLTAARDAAIIELFELVAP